MTAPQNSDSGPGPGVLWLARRTGRNRTELTGSPRSAATALTEAARQIADLATRLESADPGTRAAAQTEASELVREFKASPAPGEDFGKRVASILRGYAR